MILREKRLRMTGACESSFSIVEALPEGMLPAIVTMSSSLTNSFSIYHGVNRAMGKNICRNAGKLWKAFNTVNFCFLELDGNKF